MTWGGVIREAIGYLPQDQEVPKNQKQKMVTVKYGNKYGCNYSYIYHKP